MAITKKILDAVIREINFKSDQYYHNAMTRDGGAAKMAALRLPTLAVKQETGTLQGSFGYVQLDLTGKPVRDLLIDISVKSTKGDLTGVADLTDDSDLRFNGHAVDLYEGYENTKPESLPLARWALIQAVHKEGVDRLVDILTIVKEEGVPKTASIVVYINDKVFLCTETQETWLRIDDESNAIVTSQSIWDMVNAELKSNRAWREAFAEMTQDIV